MSLSDAAGNAIAGGTTGQMLGWTEVTTEETLPLDMYRFLINPIRHADLVQGNLFLRRFVDGMQEVWKTTQARIFALKDLWSIVNIDDELLHFLKRIVGWTPDLDGITGSLDAVTLRRLIGASAALWKQRGTEDAMLSVLRLTTGARLRIWNWFDFRWVLDETALGHELGGGDPWMIALPGPPGDNEYLSNLRIVDDGNLNRRLVKELVKLMRPLSERVEISYIDFLDQFETDSDNFQWSFVGLNGAALPAGVVEDGAMTVDDTSRDENAIVSVPGALDWSNYVVSWKISGEGTIGGRGFGGIFYWTDHLNFYRVGIRTLNNNIFIQKYVAGVMSFVAVGFDYSALGTIHPDVNYTLRVQVSPEGATNRIKVYIDGEEIFNVTDNSHSKGTIGVGHQPAARLTVSDVEMFQLPLESDFIDINP